MAAKNEVILNAKQMAVLDDMITVALNSTGGDFGTTDELGIKGISMKAYGAYMTQLQELGLVKVWGPVTVNDFGGKGGDTYIQYTIEDLGWTMGNYDPETRKELTTKRPISVAVETPKGKETPVSTNAKAEVAKLVKKLVSLKNKSDAEGRKIRRILRKLGHWGGLGKKGADGAAAKSKAAKKAKPANAKRLQKTMPAKKATTAPTVPTPALPSNPDQAE